MGLIRVFSSPSNSVFHFLMNSQRSVPVPSRVQAGRSLPCYTVKGYRASIQHHNHNANNRPGTVDTEGHVVTRDSTANTKTSLCRHQKGPRSVGLRETVPACLEDGLDALLSRSKFLVRFDTYTRAFRVRQDWVCSDALGTSSYVYIHSSI